jgi:hypothetical protein
MTDESRNTIGTVYEFQLREYREFIASWIEIGQKWFDEDPKVFDYKFGHDWNSDYGYKLYNKEVQDIDLELRRAISEFTEGYIAANKNRYDAARLIEWLREKPISKPPIFNDKVVRGYAWGLYTLLNSESKVFSANWETIKAEIETELKPCPFCGRDGLKTFCCGKAEPNCPRCSDLFGCNHCDVWFDTADEWNARVADQQTADLRARLEKYDAIEKFFTYAHFFIPKDADNPHLGTNADISRQQGKYHYHVSGDLPGEAETFLDALTRIQEATDEYNL